VIGLHGLIPELQPVLGALFAELADVEVTDDVAEVIELHRPARRVGQVHRAHRTNQLALVGCVAA